MEELIARQLKHQKIFAFSSYDEFFTDYFKRDIVAIEDMNRVHQFANTRKQYAQMTRLNKSKGL